NGVRLSAFSLFRNSWLHLQVPIPDSLSEGSGGQFEIEIRADRTWQPRPKDEEARDDREVSIAVCNIEVRGHRSEVRDQSSEFRDQTSGIRSAEPTSDF